MQPCVLVGNLFVGYIFTQQSRTYVAKHNVVRTAIDSLAGNFFVTVDGGQTAFLFIILGLAVVNEVEVVGTEPSGRAHADGEAGLGGHEIDGDLVGLLECRF